MKDPRLPFAVVATQLDAFNLPRGYWEAEDKKDSLEAETRKKFQVQMTYAHQCR